MEITKTGTRSAGQLASGAQPSKRSQPQTAIGFIGLGHMGKPMAANLAAAGHSVTACVRHADEMQVLAPLGLNATIDMASLFGSDIIITMLPDDAAVRDVVFGRRDPGVPGLASGMKRGAIHLCMSTISTSMASQAAAEHARKGQTYVAAPVFGNPEAAKARQLFIIAAGTASDIELCQPLFDALGQRTFIVGPDPAMANLVKLLGNMMTATTLEVLAEVVAVSRKRGLDPKLFIDVMTGTMYGGRAHKIYGDRIVAQDYAAGFVLPLVLKDTRLALAEAEAAGVPMPSVDVVRDRLITGISRGYADLDWTALGLIAGEEAGIHTGH